ncbi:hypothetical protein SASPL_157952 [Salvia splendens]|uniref:Transcription repressor n=1 Tax=Salvia splendens TaxID=180675 RepID=A0A8X8YTC5_SALSN|nr:hypothetical protein SASPL_157952 [Salvia splendens]
MAKRFKLRICRAIATTLQSCRSKHPSDLPTDPVPSLSHPPNSLNLTPPTTRRNSIGEKKKMARRRRNPRATAAGEDPPPLEEEETIHPSRSASALPPPTAAGQHRGNRNPSFLISTILLPNRRIGPQTLEFPQPEQEIISIVESSGGGGEFAFAGAGEAVDAEEADSVHGGGKVKESFAIVKKSEDPLGDFRRSMTDMIVEKQMFEKKDLEQLLQCFLS